MDISSRYARFAFSLFSCPLFFVLSPSVSAEVYWSYSVYRAPTAVELCEILSDWPVSHNCNTASVDTEFVGLQQVLSDYDEIDCRQQVKICGSDKPPTPTYVRINRAGSCDPNEYQDPLTGECFLPEAEDCVSSVGNPIDLATGMKWQTETDFEMSGVSPLKFVRYYSGSYSHGEWVHKYQSFARHVEYLKPVDAGSGVDFRQMVITRPGHTTEYFIDDDLSGNWTTQGNTESTLHNIEDTDGEVIGWRLTTDDDTVDDYNLDGYLVSRRLRNGVTLTFNHIVQIIDSNDVTLIESVEDNFGNRLSFIHDDQGRLSTMTAATGLDYLYTYNGNGMLETVTYPDGDSDPFNDPVRTYHYENTDLTWALTGITDERGIRFATWGYDADGRANLSQHADGAERTEIIYYNDDTASVTNALAKDTIYSFETVNGARKVAQVEGIASSNCLASIKTRTHDENGYPNLITDEAGQQTDFNHDDRGLEISRTEALDSAEQRTTTTQWHPTFRLPVRVTGPGLEQTYEYDINGNIEVYVEKDLVTDETRTTTATYNAYGQVTSINGPRTDVDDTTTYTYHDCSTGGECGNVKTMTDALGHVTSFTQYNPAGQPTQIFDPNGVETLLGYDAHQRLVSISLDSTFVTTLEHDDLGLVRRITQPNGSYLDYEYDDARRLVAVQDALGNRIDLTLDNAGNRIQIETRDAQGQLRKVQSNIFDELSRVLSVIGANGQSTSYSYDLKGNPEIVSEAGKLTPTINQHDALDRLIQVLDKGNGVTDISYDEYDRIETVEDPNGLVTTYHYNGFGDLVQLHSPDTGSTDYSYDAAGNLLSKTDARGKLVRYAYDSLNRRISAVYADSRINEYWTYDQTADGNQGLGRLTHVQDASGSTAYTYNRLGQVVQIDSVVGNRRYPLGFTYDAAGLLSTITYPSGRVVGYQYNHANQVVLVSTTRGSVTTTLAENIHYEPFGPMAGLVYGNGLVLNAGYDLDYRTEDLIHDALVDLSYRYDTSNNIVAIDDYLQPARSQIFNYDDMDRLSDAGGTYGAYDFTYDPTGNRTSLTLNDGEPDIYAYADGSHHLQSIAGDNPDFFVYDNAGNRVLGDDLNLVYDDRGRLRRLKNEGVTTHYNYNAMGQRVIKAGGGKVSHFGYHQGRLLFEYNQYAMREYAHLNGQPLAMWVINRNRPPEVSSELSGSTADSLRYGADAKESTHPNKPISIEGMQHEASYGTVSPNVPMPNGTVTASTSRWVETNVDSKAPGALSESIYFYHNDHLGTPKMITDTSQSIVWQADHQPFGKAIISTETIENNLRFPGQYFDEESGLHYNYFRYYDPSTGRYISSDPIGLTGGLNTYVYVNDNPVNKIDPDGLQWIMPVKAYSWGQSMAWLKWGEYWLKLTGTATVAAATVLTGPAAANTARAMACYASETAVATSPVWGNPAVQQGVIDFNHGFWMEGPPPMSAPGVLGADTAKLLKVLSDN